MASTIANYQGNGSTTDFNVPFDYLAKKFVKVTVDSREKLGGDYGDTTKDYFFVDKTTIRFNTAPASGTEIIIRRYTSATDRIVSFKDASVLKAKDLDVSTVQTIHIAEEGRDVINDALIVDKEGNWDARGHRIVNVGGPIGDTDAVNFKFYKDDAMGAYQARLKAEASRDAAKVSETNAKASEVNAKESEDTAKASAGTAVSAAKHADAVKTENQAILEEARQLQTDIETSESNAYENSVIATQKADEAKVSERNAKASEANAKTSEVSAAESATLAKSSADASASTLAEVKAEGPKQVKSITDTATAEISKITSEGESQVTRVTTTGNQQVSAVTAEGTKQVNLAKAQVALAVQEVTKAKEQVSLATQQATIAITKATEAEDSATSASQSATAADASAKSASASVSTATTQATNASNSAKVAKLSEDNAALSKTAAGTSETNAKASEVEAKRQADLAKGYAEDAASGQLNADWAVTDSKSKAFIKNKPTLGALASKDSIAYSEITGTPSEPDLSGLATKNELQTGLAGKANTLHTHTIANVTNLQTALDAKANDATLQVDLTNIRQSITEVSSKVDGIGDTLSPTYAKKQAILDACDKALNGTNPVNAVDPTFINQLAEKLSKLGTVRPLGFHYLHPYGTVPADSIICNGATYSRALYKDFFDYITTQGWVKTEAEWQEIATRDNGFCPFYSSGDGSTNFRTPKFAPYQQIAIASANVGKYSKAGLPDIRGSFALTHEEVSNVSASGCFTKSEGKICSWTGNTKNSGTSAVVTFEASGYNSAYGASTTVQPESHEWVMCVVAYGVATNVGSVDIQNVMSAVNAVQAQVGEIPTPKAYVTETWHSGTSWYRKWSDGWIEQGGRVNAVDYSSKTQNVTFMVTMSNTNYFAVFNTVDSSHDSWDFSSRVSLLKMGGMTVKGSRNGNSAYTGESTWYVCGY